MYSRKITSLQCSRLILIHHSTYSSVLKEGSLTAVTVNLQSHWLIYDNFGGNLCHFFEV